MASIGAIAELWPYRMGACSHKQVINIICMILAFSVIIYEVLKILLEKWPKNSWIFSFTTKTKAEGSSSKFHMLFCRGVTLFEWNFVVPQGGVSQGSIG